MGRFHDAVRVGPGGARSPQGQNQCSRDCRVLHRWRFSAVVSVLLLLFGESSVASVCGRDAGGLGRVRLRQGSVYRRQATEKCVANGGRRWVGGCCGVRHCPPDWMTCMKPSKIWIEQCEAAREIEHEFGTQRALAYLIGEKFLNFLDAAETDTDFR